MAIGSLDLTVLDCPDPAALAEFYRGLVGGTVEVDERGDWAELRGTGPGPGLAFQLAPDHVPPQWPDGDVPQQAHLDVNVADLDEAEAAAVALGARATGRSGPGEADAFRVYLDPAGHPFCLCIPIQAR